MKELADKRGKKTKDEEENLNLFIQRLILILYKLSRNERFMRLNPLFRVRYSQEVIVHRSALTGRR